MSVFTDNYKELIILQYYSKTKAQGEIKLWSDEFENVYDFLNEFFTQFDLDQATGDRLDKIGKIVGISRIVEGGVAKKFFGYIGAANVLGYDEGRYFVEGDDLYTDSELTDGQYRLFIKAKISKNNASAVLVDDERDGLQSAIQLLFDGEAYVIDNQDMSLNLYVNDDLPTDDLILIIQADLLPKPQAVRYRWIVQIAGCVPVPPGVFAASTIDLNETTQYLELQGATSRLDLGTATPAVSAWIYHDGTTDVIIFHKGRHVVNGEKDISVSVRGSTGAIEIVYGENDGTFDFQFNVSTHLLSVGWHHIVLYDDRSSTEREIKYYVDGVDVSGGVWTNQNGFDSHLVDMTNSYSAQMGVTQNLAGDNIYHRAPAFLGVVIGAELTLADAVYLYNSGVAECWGLVESDNNTLYNKFTEVFNLGTFDGSTELSALTGKINGWELSNVNSAPFDGTGLDVECSTALICSPPFGYEGAPNAAGYDSGTYADVLTLP